MIKLNKTINRRSLIVGTMAMAGTAALPMKANSKSSDSVLKATLAGMSKAMEGVNIMQVISNSFAPYYRKGDLIFVKPQCGQTTDHVFLNRKGAESIFGVLVHRDAKAIYVRGFKTGDRLQSVPLNSLAEWGRIVASYRV